MDKQQLKQMVLQQAQADQGRNTLSCHRAHVLAEDCSVTLQAIGQVCQDEGIKVVNCQLGCFGKYASD